MPFTVSKFALATEATEISEKNPLRSLWPLWLNLLLPFRPHDDERHGVRGEVAARDAQDVVDLHLVDRPRITFEKIVPEAEHLGVDQIPGDLCVRLKLEGKTARQIGLRRVELVGGDR